MRLLGDNVWMQYPQIYTFNAGNKSTERYLSLSLTVIVTQTYFGPFLNGIAKHNLILTNYSLSKV